MSVCHTLSLNILTNHVPAAPFANRGDKEAISPELPAPKFSLEIGVLPKERSGGDALDDLDESGGGKLWGCTKEVMDVIRVKAELLEPDTVALFDF